MDTHFSFASKRTDFHFNADLLVLIEPIVTGSNIFLYRVFMLHFFRPFPGPSGVSESVAPIGGRDSAIIPAG